MRLLRQLALLSVFSIINIVVVLSIVDPQPSSAGPTISAGDANGDSTVDIADAVYVLSYLFQGGPAPVAIAQTGLTAEQEEILSHMSIEYLDDGLFGLRKTIRFTAVNVQVVNGLGATYGDPDSPWSTPAPGTGWGQSIEKNGLGNLIVGYDEVNTSDPDWRKDGSHNLVIGPGHSYSHLAGMVIGHRNRIVGQRCTAIGSNSDAGPNHNAHVVGGTGNEGAAANSVVVGGAGNLTTGSYGGTIVGGGSNETYSGAFPSSPIANPTVVGGQGNFANGAYSTVSGGLDRSVSGEYDWRAGSLFEDQ